MRRRLTLALVIFMVAVPPASSAIWSAWRRFWYWPLGDADPRYLGVATVLAYAVVGALVYWRVYAVRVDGGLSPPASGRRPRGLS